MSLTASVLGIAIAAAIGFWLFGGVLLRFAGTLALFAGGLALATGERYAPLLLAGGAALWLAGRLHRAVRQSV